MYCFTVPLTASSLLARGDAWIGLHALSSRMSFEWSDGEPVKYTNWAQREPNNAEQGEDCVMMYAKVPLDVTTIALSLSRPHVTRFYLTVTSDRNRKTIAANRSILLNIDVTTRTSHTTRCIPCDSSKSTYMSIQKSHSIIHLLDNDLLKKLDT